MSFAGVQCAMIDPLENDLFDIPNYENIEDEAFPPLPPPMSPGQDEGDPFANGKTSKSLNPRLSFTCGEESAFSYMAKGKRQLKMFECGDVLSMF